MKRFVFAGLVALAYVISPTLPVNAMPGASPSSLGITDADTSLIQVRGGHGGGHGHIGRGGRGHHFGWSRGRGHHYGRRH